MTRRVLAAALVAAAVLTGCGTTPDVAPTAPPTVQVTVPAAAPAVAPPVRLRIPDLAIDSTDVMPLGLNAAGEMEVPPLEQPERLGYLAWSPRLAAEHSTVIAGHVDGDGRPGVFAELVTLPVGAEVLVDRGGQATVYEVASVEDYDKAVLPWPVIVAGGPDALLLITCGGPLVTDTEGRRTHRDNIVVTAVPLPAS